jgi:multicomponent Na+:H+ antiporter subunit F
VNAFFLVVAGLIGVLLVIGLHRVWDGPTVFDRLVAVALVTANSLVILILVATVLDRVETVVDIAIAYALLAFTLPLAIGKYYEVRRGVAGTEPEAGR